MLSTGQKRDIARLAKSTCANYSEEYGCLPRDKPCFMLYENFREDRVCPYFREAVLPNDPALAAAFRGEELKPCKRCGEEILVSRNLTYCDKCAETVRLNATAARMRKYRAKAGATVTLLPLKSVVN